MKALITGASSGIGRDMARILSTKGFELWLAARRTDRLEELKDTLPYPAHVLGADLSRAEACQELYGRLKDEQLDLVINNAGFGLFGTFAETDLERDLAMIDTNIRAVHILTKLFLQDFKSRNQGAILNVSSSAGFFAGPLLSTYYATKSYVLRLTEAIHEELRRDGSAVYIGVFCPGPVRTEFDNVANVRFSVRGLTSEQAAHFAIEGMEKGKMIIMPGLLMKLARFGERFVPEQLMLRLSYHMQDRKNG